MRTFKNSSNAFNYSFDENVLPGSEFIVKMPPVSANKRGVNDIGFMADDGITLYSTIAAKPDENTIWQQIQPYDEINKTTSYIKVVNENSTESQRVYIRVIMN